MTQEDLSDPTAWAKSLFGAAKLGDKRRTDRLVLVASQLIPLDPQHTTHVVEFYYPEEIALFEREFIEAQQAAYKETGIEDAELCMRMDRGRKALWEQGLNDAGPYQSPMEDAMLHFHEWLRARLGRPAQR
jgi:choline monooxygenase